MKKVTKRERKQESRNAFVTAILESGVSEVINNELYVRGNNRMNSRGQMVKMPLVRATYG